jgi:hypothetical protein
MSIEVDDEGWVILNGKRCGRIEGNWYVTERNTKDHFFVKCLGYPIAHSILIELKRRFISRIKFIEKGKKIRYYESTVDDYLGASLFRERGFEEQRCIPVKELKRIEG